MNLTKEVKDLYNENYEPLEKEIKKKDYRKWKDRSCSCISRINIANIAISPKAI
jgi:hypothetical protein